MSAIIIVSFLSHHCCLQLSFTFKLFAKKAYDMTLYSSNMKVSMMKLLFMISLLLLNSSVVFSELSSSTQKFTMINFFERLQKVPYYFDSYQLRWNVRVDPCKWDGVTCNHVTNSVTQLYFSHSELSNSSFLSIACQIDTLY